MSWKARLMGIVCSVLASLPSAFFVHFILNSTKKFQGSEIPFVVSLAVYILLTIHAWFNPAFYVGYVRGILKLWKFGGNFPSV